MSKYEYRKSMEPYKKLLVPTVYGEIPTFLSIHKAETKEDLKDADVAIIGVGQQHVGSWLVGKEIRAEVLDPMRFRQASIIYGLFLPELGIDIGEHLNLVDYGDVSLSGPVITDEDSLDAIKKTEKKIGEALDAGCMPITIEAYPYAPVKAVADRTKGKVGVIFLDSHGDNLEEHYGMKWNPCTWVPRVAEIGNVDMTRFVHIGMRGPRNYKEQIDWYKKRGCHLFTIKEIDEMSMQAVIKEAINIAHDGTESVVLNLNFDVLDMGEAPGLIEPLGITKKELFTFARELGKSGLNAFNVTTFISPAPQMYWIGTWAILYLLAGVVETKLKT